MHEKIFWHASLETRLRTELEAQENHLVVLSLQNKKPCLPLLTDCGQTRDDNEKYK